MHNPIHEMLLVLCDTLNMGTAFLLLLFNFPITLLLLLQFLFLLLFRALLLLLGRNAKLLAAEGPKPRVVFKATSHLRIPNADQISSDSQTKVRRKKRVHMNVCNTAERFWSQKQILTPMPLPSYTGSFTHILSVQKFNGSQ